MIARLTRGAVARQRTVRRLGASLSAALLTLSLFSLCPNALNPLSAAFAALPDEIQVYTDDINKPGEYGLELHVNTTPRGQTQPGYAGETVTDRGLRITPEFSYGVSKDFDVGLYLPLSIQGGNWALAGYKLRAKWLPIRGDDEIGGPFAGINWELSNIRRQFEASRHNAEMRIMLGHRSSDWLFAVNPTFGWALSSSQEDPAARNPKFRVGYKVARTINQNLAAGVEYYNDKGSWRSQDPSGEQSKTLFWTIDVDNKIVPFNLGLGRGLNGASDRWTLKMIFEIPTN